MLGALPTAPPRMFLDGPEYDRMVLGVAAAAVVCFFGGIAMIVASQTNDGCRDGCEPQSCTRPCPHQTSHDECTRTYACTCSGSDENGPNCQNAMVHTNNWALNRAGIASLVFGIVVCFACFAFGIARLSRRHYLMTGGGRFNQLPVVSSNQPNNFAAHAAPAQIELNGRPVTSVYTYPQPTVPPQYSQQQQQQQYAPTQSANNYGNMYNQGMPVPVYQYPQAAVPLVHGVSVLPNTQQSYNGYPVTQGTVVGVERSSTLGGY